MTLEKYISEADSHGRKHNYRNELTLDYVKNWLEGMGMIEDPFTSPDMYGDYGMYYVSYVNFISGTRKPYINASYKNGRKLYDLHVEFSAGNNVITMMELCLTRSTTCDVMGHAEGTDVYEYEEVMDMVENTVKKKK